MLLIIVIFVTVVIGGLRLRRGRCDPKFGPRSSLARSRRPADAGRPGQARHARTDRAGAGPAEQSDSAVSQRRFPYPAPG